MSLFESSSKLLGGRLACLLDFRALNAFWFVMNLEINLRASSLRLSAESSARGGCY
jgi:hypothetical protein